MKALVFADLHTRSERDFVPVSDFEECDFIILVGDTSDTKRTRPGAIVGTRQDFIFDLPTIGVFGNHENWDLIRSGKHTMIDVHKTVVDYKGLKFSGVGGVVAKRPKRIYHNYKKDIVKWLTKLSEKKLDIDVFVMHEPPKGCFDFVRGKHRGVEEYRAPLEAIAPSWLFVGHMHTYRGIIHWPCGTTVVNPGIGHRGEYAILDFDKERIVFKN